MCVLKFLEKAFSEEGVPSYARISSGFLVLVSSVWVSYLVVVTRTLPDLSGVALLVSGSYAVNAAKNVVAAAKGNPNGPQLEKPAPLGTVQSGQPAPTQERDDG